MGCLLTVTVTSTDGHQRQYTHEWTGTATDACDRRYRSLRDYGAGFVTRDANTLTVIAPAWKVGETGICTERLAFYDREEEPTPEN
jgi:hypothetical protein